MTSKLETQFASQVMAHALPTPVREYRFAPPRKWRLDFAWPDHLVAVEIEGAVWTGGRHTRGAGFTNDCEKYSAASIAGWTLLRVTGEHIRNGQAIAWLMQALGSWALTGNQPNED